jgi:hypothetical protein
MERGGGHQCDHGLSPASRLKKHPGAQQHVLNSLRLTWTISLLADAAGLLRALALMDSPPKFALLQELIPMQMSWSWENLGKPEK